MTVYLIHGDTVAAHAKTPAALPDGAIALRSLKELTSRDLPMRRLVALWNALPGHAPVARFKSRDVALRRLWAALAQLTPSADIAKPPHKKKAPKETPKKAAQPKPELAKTADKTVRPDSKRPSQHRGKTAVTTRPDSKQAKVIKLLRRPQGATIEELAEATGWQRHSVRGVLSGAPKKRLGLTIESTKEARGRVYRITAPGSRG